ncbi:hypothetical protein GCM10023096_85640 [Nonomuraea ferruginea]
MEVPYGAPLVKSDRFTPEKGGSPVPPEGGFGGRAVFPLGARVGAVSAIHRQRAGAYLKALLKRVPSMGPKVIVAQGKGQARDGPRRRDPP